jgi:hypothetical protein
LRAAPSSALPVAQPLRQPGDTDLQSLEFIVQAEYQGAPPLCAGWPATGCALGCPGNRR